MSIELRDIEERIIKYSEENDFSFTQVFDELFDDIICFKCDDILKELKKFFENEDLMKQTSVTVITIFRKTEKEIESFFYNKEKKRFSKLEYALVQEINYKKINELAENLEEQQKKTIIDIAYKIFALSLSIKKFVQYKQ